MTETSTASDDFGDFTTVNGRDSEAGFESIFNPGEEQLPVVQSGCFEINLFEGMNVRDAFIGDVDGEW